MTWGWPLRLKGIPDKLIDFECIDEPCSKYKAARV